MPHGPMPTGPAPSGWPGHAVVMGPGSPGPGGPPPRPGPPPGHAQRPPPQQLVHVQVVSRPPGPAPPASVQVPPGPAQTSPAAASAPGLCGAPPPGAVPPGNISVEVVLEVAHVRKVALASLRPELRTLALVPGIDGEGRRVARLGRGCQPHWFEALLADGVDFNAVSREACDICWGGPDPSQAPLHLRSLGVGQLLIDGALLGRGECSALRPGSMVSFCSGSAGGDAGAQQLDVLLTLVVHCAAPPRPAELAPQQSVQAPQQQVVAHRPLAPPSATVDSAWRLECVYAAGLSTEAFWALPAGSGQIRFDPSGEPVILGRQNQPEAFELLLDKDTKLLQCVSRRHFQLELCRGGEGAGSDESPPDALPPAPLPPRLLVTNLSQNVALVSQRPLRQGEASEVSDGDTLSFAHSISEVAGGEGAEEGAGMATTSYVPFLTMRIVGPPPLPAASPFVMVQPPSLAVVIGGPEGASKDALPSTRPPSPMVVLSPNNTPPRVPVPAWGSTVAAAAASSSPSREVPVVVVSSRPRAEVIAQEHAMPASNFLSSNSPGTDAMLASVPKTMPLAGLPPRGDRDRDVLGDSFDKTRATACWGASAFGSVPKAASTQPMVRPSGPSIGAAQQGPCCIM